MSQGEPTDAEILAACTSLTNLRRWVKEVYEDTGRYEEIAFEALGSTVQQPGWTHFLVVTAINIATGIIDTALVVAEVPAAIPAVNFLSAEINLWLSNPSSKPNTLLDVYVDYAKSHLDMQEAMEQQLAHYIDPTSNHQNLRTAWNNTFQGPNGVKYKVSDLAKPEHAFPDVGDAWSTLKANATREFQKRLWNLIVLKTCTYYRNSSVFYTTQATTLPEAGNELADYVRRGLYTTDPGVYARRDFTGKDDQTGGLEYEIASWNLGLNGNEFPKVVCDILFQDDTPGHIINPSGLFPRDYVFKQFSSTKPNLFRGNDSPWKEIPDGDNEWDYTAGYFPELIEK